MGTCLTGMAYWTITSLTLALLLWDNPPTNPEQWAFFPTHYWVCTGIERMAKACAFIPSPIFVFCLPPIPFFQPSHWNEHFTKPETFNCLLLKKKINWNFSTSCLLYLVLIVLKRGERKEGRREKSLKWEKETLLDTNFIWWFPNQDIKISADTQK